MDQKNGLRVFLCHSSGDKTAVRSLYKRLQSEGMAPWLDSENLLPGQDWRLSVSDAVQNADVVLVCMSKGSITKTGFVQKEIGYALDRAEEHPEGRTFIIPVRLELCEVPKRLLRWQWVDLFDEQGYEKLLLSLNLLANSLRITSEDRAKIVTARPSKEYSANIKRANRLAQETEKLVKLKTPISGTFYDCPPGGPSFVRVGDEVQAGRVVCIVEAMKLMNEIESDTDGIIVSQPVRNGEPVEYGQALFLIYPQRSTSE